MKTSKRKILEALYDSGYDFKVIDNTIELLNGSDHDDKLIFTFDEDEDISLISGKLND